MIIISSQRYLNDDIVTAKLNAKDFDVLLNRIVVDGQEFCVVIDGHHSLEAARIAGVEPQWVINDADLGCESVEDWLTERYMDDDWYDVQTGQLVWQ